MVRRDGKDVHPVGVLGVVEMRHDVGVVLQREHVRRWAGCRPAISPIGAPAVTTCRTWNSPLAARCRAALTATMPPSLCPTMQHVVVRAHAGPSHGVDHAALVAGDFAAECAQVGGDARDVVVVQARADQLFVPGTSTITRSGDAVWCDVEEADVDLAGPRPRRAGPGRRAGRRDSVAARLRRPRRRDRARRRAARRRRTTG